MKWGRRMKNFKIGKKLFVTFGSIIILLCIVVAVASIGLIGNGNKFTDFYENGYNITNKVMDLRRAIQASGKYVGYATMTADSQKTAEYIDSARKESETMEDGLAYLKEHFTGDQQLVTEFENKMYSIRDARDKVYEYAMNNRNEDASALFFSQVMPGYIEANNALEKIYDNATTSADANYEGAEHAKVLSIITLSAVALLAIAVTILLSLYIIKSLTKPIAEIEQAAIALASGNLDVSVQYESKDELGSLSDQIRMMANNLKSIITDEDYLLGELSRGNFNISSKNQDLYVGQFQSIIKSMHEIRMKLSETLLQINESADQVAGGSEQVSDGAQALSQGATEQASSVEELAATVNEISVQVKTSADNAVEASGKANGLGEKMTISNGQMSELLKAMKDISNSSNEIGKIIKTIEDIAFQTNILALNAAVEAARAGAAGKGFAVVADEVRNLASKSAEASKSTSSLIEGSLRAVENGTRIADETAKSLVEAVEGAKDVAQTIDKISEASKEQASSIVQVSQGIDQISSVVQTNSATAEESAAASQELSGQAQMLKQFVGRFQLADTKSTRRYQEAPLSEENHSTVQIDRQPASLDKY